MRVYVVSTITTFQGDSCCKSLKDYARLALFEEVD